MYTSFTIDEPAPGVKAIFSFVAPDQKSGKVCTALVIAFSDPFEPLLSEFVATRLNSGRRNIF